MRLTIPPYIPESRLDGCDIIDIKYDLEFRVEISSKSQIVIIIPMTVGTANSMTATRNHSHTDIDPNISNWQATEGTLRSNGKNPRSKKGKGGCYPHIGVFHKTFNKAINKDRIPFLVILDCPKQTCTHN